MVMFHKFGLLLASVWSGLVPVVSGWAASVRRKQHILSIDDEIDGINKTVNCTFLRMIDDSHPGDPNAVADGFDFGQCVDHDGESHYIKEDETTSGFASGDELSLGLVVTTSPQHPDINMSTPWEIMGVPLYKVATSTLTSPEVAGLMTEGPKDMDVLMIRLEYSDAKPVLSESQVMEDLYADPKDYEKSKFPGSMSDMIKHASYGNLRLPKSKGKVVTVKTGTKWEDVRACPYMSIAKMAVAKVKEQHPDIDPETFTFREIFIPKEPNGGCIWGGLAITGCGYPARLPAYGKCYAWYRVEGPFVRSHELGHNLGLLHDGGEEHNKFVEYGDSQAAMGASYRMSSFTVADRFQLGFLHNKPGEVLEWTATQGSVFTLASMSLPLNQPGAQYVGIRIACPDCVPKVERHKGIKGGHLWVSFRGDEGYSNIQVGGLKKEYQNKVYVHLARAFTHLWSGKGSEMWARLSANGHFEDGNTPHTIFVCSIDGDLATISIGSSMSTAKNACSGKTTVNTGSTTTTTVNTGNTNVNTFGPFCKESCRKEDKDFDWWETNTTLKQLTPKCAWWQCRECSECFKSNRNQCINWCNVQASSIRDDSCEFSGCSKCSFCDSS